MGPKAREEHLLIQAVGREVVVFDRTRNAAHHLNEAATIVWKACSGDTSVPDLVGHLRRAGLDGDDTLVLATLDQLQRAELLAAGGDVSQHLDRRAALRAAAFLVPAVVSIVVPTPAEAASGGLFSADPPCTYSVIPTTVSVPANGGTGTISVFANVQSCAWTAAASGGWLSVSPAAAGGIGPVAWTAELNPTSDRRTATATIAGQTVTFNQDPRMMEITDINGTYTGTATRGTPVCQTNFFVSSYPVRVVIDVNANGRGTVTHYNSLDVYFRKYMEAVASFSGQSSVNIVTNQLNTEIGMQPYVTQVTGVVDTNAWTYNATETLNNVRTGCKDTFVTVAKK